MSKTRTAVAAIGGLLIGWTVGGLTNRNVDITTEEATAAGVVLAVLATMVLLIALQHAARPKPASAFKPQRPTGPVTAVRERWHDGRRLSGVVGIAKRNGMGGALGLARADDTDELAAEELGRGFVEEGLFPCCRSARSRQPVLLVATSPPARAGRGRVSPGSLGT